MKDERYNRAVSPKEASSFDYDPVAAAKRWSSHTFDVEELSISVEVKDREPIHLLVDSISSDPSVRRAALIMVQALDSRGMRVPIPGWTPVSDAVAEYQYLKPGDPAVPGVTRITVVPPEGAETIAFKGRRWVAAVRTVVVGKPVIYHRGEFGTPGTSPSGQPILWYAPDISVEQAIPGGAADAQIDVYATGEDTGVTPLYVSLWSGEREMLPPEGLPVNSNKGPYIPVQLDSANERRTTTTIVIPKGATTIRFAGVMWGTKTATYRGLPQVTFGKTNSLKDVCRFIQRCRDEPLVVLDTTAPPLGHETLSLRPNNLAEAFSSLGVNVLFVPFSSTQDKEYIVSEKQAQIPRSSWDDIMSELWRESSNSPRVYVCTSFPSLECFARMNYLKQLGWHVVYEVRDDMEEFNRVGYSKWYHPLLEVAVAEKADDVVAVSPALARKIHWMTPNRVTVDVVPNGVAANTLEESAGLRTQSSLSRRDPKKVGYIGHMTKSWFDWPLLSEAARRLPKYSFELIGHGHPEGIDLPSNVKLLGPMTHSEALSVVSTWTVGLVPFIDSPLTRGVDPNKAYEYYAWGLRVLCSKMGSMYDYPSTKVYSGVDEFVEMLQELTRNKMDVSELETLSRFAQSSSWDCRAKVLAKKWGLA